MKRENCIRVGESFNIPAQFPPPVIYKGVVRGAFMRAALKILGLNLWVTWKINDLLIILILLGHVYE